MLFAQQFKCAACDNRLKHRGNIDHDHSTTEVRSILCTPCNLTLGMMNESSFRLRKLADYIDKFKKPT